MLKGSVIEKLLPKELPTTPILFEDKNKAELSEREILYKVLFDMKRDLTELKKITFDLIQKEGGKEILDSINPSIFDEKNNHLEYVPMINQRVFQIGGTGGADEEEGQGFKDIMNIQFNKTYKKFLHLLMHQNLNNQALDLPPKLRL